MTDSARPDVDALKPCPFCGGEAQFGEDKDYASITCVRYDCQAALIASSGPHRKSKAIEKWNTRATPASGEAAEGAAKIVCFAEGDRCLGCPHYHGNAAECTYKPYAPPKPAPDAMREDFVSDDWFSEHRPKASINIEDGARAIARCRGHDPDDLAPRTEMCTGDNEQVPWWKVFEEEAEACLSAWAALAAPVPSPDGAHEKLADKLKSAIDFSDKFNGIAKIDVALLNECITALRRSPSDAGAAEPVARGSDAAEADRYFEMASMFGNQLQALAGVVQEAIDLLTERKQGNAARSPGHNARVILETALKNVSPSALPARQPPPSSNGDSRG